MSIFEFDDFRSFIRAHLQLIDSRRGAYAKMAKQLGIHSTSLSQILNGVKPLSLEQGAEIADYFSLTEQECEYFLALIQFDRAGSVTLKAKIKKQLNRFKKQKNNLALALPTEQSLTIDQQIVFYSSWHYSAIRVLSSLPDFQTAESIADRLGLSRRDVIEKIKFLVSAGLCVDQGGKIGPGPAYTHLEASSPLISKYHSNWRVCAMQKHAKLQEDDLAYSSLMSISRRDAQKVQSSLSEIIKKISSIREKSECEEMYLLGIDWIEM